MEILWTLVSEIFILQKCGLGWRCSFLVECLVARIHQRPALDFVDVNLIRSDAANIQCLFVQIDFQVQQFTQLTHTSLLLLLPYFGHFDLSGVQVDLSGLYFQICEISHTKASLLHWLFLNNLELGLMLLYFISGCHTDAVSIASTAFVRVLLTNNISIIVAIFMILWRVWVSHHYFLSVVATSLWVNGLTFSQKIRFQNWTVLSLRLIWFLLFSNLGWPLLMVAGDL